MINIISQGNFGTTISSLNLRSVKRSQDWKWQKCRRQMESWRTVCAYCSKRQLICELPTLINTIITVSVVSVCACVFRECHTPLGSWKCLQLQLTRGNNLSTRPWNGAYNCFRVYLSFAQTHHQRDFIIPGALPSSRSFDRISKHGSQTRTGERVVWFALRLTERWQPAGKLRPPFDDFDGARN